MQIPPTHPKSPMPTATAAPNPKGWYIYLAIMILFNALIFASPLLLASGSTLAIPTYAAFKFTCHQLDSRSLCYYNDGGNIIGDCLPQNGVLRYERNDVVLSAGRVGYKIPVCTRDVGIYGAMLLGALIWPFVRKPYSRKWPHLAWLVIALLPTAIDGFTQLFGWRESTNLLRLWTGAAMGLGLAFFLIPACNQIFNKTSEKPTPHKTSKPAAPSS